MPSHGVRAQSQRQAANWGEGGAVCTQAPPCQTHHTHPPRRILQESGGHLLLMLFIGMCVHIGLHVRNDCSLARSLTCGRAGHRVYDAREAAQALRVCQRRLACALTHKCTLHILCLYGDTVHLLLVAMYTHTPACEIRHI